MFLSFRSGLVSDSNFWGLYMTFVAVVVGHFGLVGGGGRMSVGRGK